MTKRIREHLPTIISVVSTVILLVITLLWFNGSVGKKVEINNESYLVDSTRNLASVMRGRIDDWITIFEAQTEAFDGVDMSDSREVADVLMSIGITDSFRVAGAADRSGKTVMRLGNAPENIKADVFFADIMKGRAAVSSDLVKGSNGETVIAFGVPIGRTGEPAGVLFGGFGSSAFSKLMDVGGSTRRFSNILLDSSGNVIMSSDNIDTERMGLLNMFDDTGAVCPPAGEGSVTECMVGGTGSYVAVSDVGINGWYLVSVMPKSAAELQAGDISRDVTILVMLVSFAFAIMFISVMYLIKSNNDILRANEKFRLVTVESQDMVFDYNFQKQLLSLDGNTDNIISDGRNEFNRTETMNLIGLIHEEDKDIKKQLLEVAENGEMSVKGEFRLKCTDETYSWFRVRGTVVRAHDGSAQRFIGSLINVDEQMNREMRLIGKAETDPVTGVYNKSAFYDRVNEKLRSASDSDLFAIYIIDIDNFKSVNDDLGHSTGDQVLSDVAKKLCIVFSDMDYVGRIGGDEFAAFLHLSSKARNVGMNIIEGKAKAICSHLSETYRGKKKQVSITASVGVAIYPYSGRDYNTLFRRADKALERAKNGGKNRYGIYTPDDNN